MFSSIMIRSKTPFSPAVSGWIFHLKCAVFIPLFDSAKQILLHSSFKIGSFEIKNEKTTYYTSLDDFSKTRT
ncbi:hypothetical protein BLGI_954 [Brevibacillus laterosporus GI-9]|nr:hypothetical protein BLGI_954 [Brevibacillus laterosporus GI-9]